MPEQEYPARTGVAVGHGPVHRPEGAPERRLFELPEDQHAAARSWLVHGERRPRAARRASSVAVVRDGLRGVETLLRYRAGSTPLGAVAFPGGSLETFDEDECAWFGPTPAQWARVLGLDDHRLARRHVAGAIRELFEETGILLAGTDEHSVVENPGGGEWMEARQALDEQQTTLAALLNRRGHGLRTDLLRAVGRWHSPHFAHRRFDTQYFAVAVPHAQDTTLLAGKGLWADWVPAAWVLAGRNGTRLGDAIGRPETVGRRLGQLTVPPVELLLERMAAAGSTVEFLMDLTIRGRVPEYTPELQGAPDGEGDFRLGVSLPGGRWGR
ncbi:NUDIX hydrolase [Citricoccus sp. SGAir0253]|uniref:NUDIX hydrolase n=1 Tax=Citricoccus sp. SGAir0253 TaxID=2567881 RepID=UPI0010CCC82A|nr:NUDIX hydrolase [Citricoccus sp. SGAir0253]QCU77337.1 NUDIX hydrolase [Citricoccus sp. SGAir0253]